MREARIAATVSAVAVVACGGWWLWSLPHAGGDSHGSVDLTPLVIAGLCVEVVAGVWLVAALVFAVRRAVAAGRDLRRAS